MTIPRDYARCPGKYNNVDHHGYEGNEMKTVNEIMELVEHHRTAGGSVEHHATKEALRTAIEELAADAERYQWPNTTTSITIAMKETK